MTALADTNILARLTQPRHSHHALALAALDTLNARGEDLVIVPQNLYEFWSICTRPAGENGLGLTTRETRDELAKARFLFRLIPDLPSIFTTWEQLVSQHDVKGRNSHDARLIAAMLVHGIPRLLTFNLSDFSRYTEIVLLDPAAVTLP